MSRPAPPREPGGPSPSALDPFESIPNPAFYVPRAAAERALLDLEEALWRGTTALALVGPVGIGRTMLMRVLEQRLGPEYRIVAVPYAALPPQELFGLVLSLLEEDLSGDAEQALLSAATGRAERGPLILLLQEGDTLPVASARRLGELLARAAGSLRLVVRCDPASAERLGKAFGGGLEEVRFDAPLSEAECDRYVRARLALGRTPGALRLRFHAGTVRELQQRSAGIPAALNGLCRAVGSESPPAWVREAPVDGGGPTELGEDPFGPAVEPGAYMPRPGSEALLAEIEAALDGGARVVAIEGPPGIGKSMLLRVLEKRLAPRTPSVSLPYAALAPDEFWAFVLARLEAPPSPDPRAASLARVRGLSGADSRLVLLVDDAHALPEETVRDLAEALERCQGALRLVVCAPEASAPRFPGLADDSRRLRFERPMSVDETTAYVRGRLERYAAPRDVVNRFDSPTLSDLHRASGGNPRELHRLAGRIEGGPRPLSSLLRAAPARPEAHRAPPPRVAPARPPAERRPPPRAASAGPRRRPRRAAALTAAAALGVALGLLAAPGVIDEAPLPAPPADPVVATAPVRPVPVHINADPWAHIEIDGVAAGTTPLGNVGLAPGMHRFRAELPDGTVIEREVAVSPSRRHIVF